MTNDAGKVTGVIVVAVDISDRVTAEEALRQAQLRLVEADRLAALGTLAAGAAHEINNPLTYVSLNLGRLMTLEQSRTGRDAISLHRAEILTEAREGLDRVARIVRDLKTFSRVDARDSLGPVDIQHVLDSAIRIAGHEINHRARLTRDYAVDTPAVHGDEGRLGQLFLNLLLNAAQSIPEGEAHLNEIHVATQRLPDGRVAVTVSDTGTGIAPEIRARIFDPFFTTKPRVGTGLGLSICKGIAMAMGGDIEVESVLGVGATFTTYTSRRARTSRSSRARSTMTPRRARAGGSWSSTMIAWSWRPWPPRSATSTRSSSAAAAATRSASCRPTMTSSMPSSATSCSPRSPAWTSMTHSASPAPRSSTGWSS